MIHVLVIDDDKDVRERMQSSLELMGWSADCAEEFEEALALIDTTRYSVVITDLELAKFKGLQGLSILDHVRQHAPGTKVIVISGHSDPEVAKEAFAHGVDKFLAKPFSLANLAAAVISLAGN